jgi:ABC-2 type transport system permease protein
MKGAVMSELTINQPGGRYGVAQMARAEWAKLRTLRSTWVTLGITAIGALGITALVANHAASNWKYGHFGGFDPTNRSLAGLALASLAIGVLGVLAVTGEYGSGTMRSSLSVAPRRPLLVATKVLVLGILSLIAGEFLSFVCFFTGQGILSGRAPSASLGQPGVLRAVLLSGAFLALLGLLAMGLGFVIRHTAGAIAAFVGVTLLLPVVLQSFNGHGNPGKFAPAEILTNSVSAVVPQSGQLSAGTGFLWMIFYAAVVLTVGVVLFVKRDA